MTAFTERRLGLFGVVMLLAIAVLVIHVAAAGASISTTQLQRAPFVAAGIPPLATPRGGGTTVAIGPVVAATNTVLARAPFVAVPIPAATAFGSGTVGVASASAVAAADGFQRAALGAPVPGPLVLNAAPISVATGLAILGGSLLVMVIIGATTVLISSGRSRRQVSYSSAGSVSVLGQRQPEKLAAATDDSRRKAA